MEGKCKQTRELESWQKYASSSEKTGFVRVVIMDFWAEKEQAFPSKAKVLGGVTDP